MNVMKKMVGFGMCLALFMGCVAADQKQSTSQSSPVLKKYMAAGEALENQGNLTGALEQYRLALTVEPDNQTAMEKKIFLETTLKNRAEGHYKAGLNFEKSGKEAKARKAFLAALQNWPDHEKALKKLTPGLVMDTGNFIVHTIAAGESISKLAKIYYGNYKRYPVISLFNKIKDPRRIVPGQKVNVPEIEGIPLSRLQEIQANYLAGTKLPDQDSAESDTVSQEALQYEQEMTDAADQAADYPYEAPAPTDMETRVEQGQEGVAMEEPAAVMEEAIVDEPMPEASVAGDDIQESAPVEIAVEEMPDYSGQGKEYFEKKQYKEAIVELRKASDATPGDQTVTDYLFKSHFQYGLVLFNEQNYLSARDNFQAAYHVNQGCDNCPDYVDKCLETYKEKHYTQGIVFFGKEQLKEAIEQWELVEAIDPDYKKLPANLKKANLLNQRLEKIKKGKNN